MNASAGRINIILMNSVCHTRFTVYFSRVYTKNGCHGEVG